MNSTMRPYLIMAGVLLISLAQAAPRKYSHCEIEKEINVPAGGAGHYLDEDCRTAYVLPPKTGRITVNGFESELGLDRGICRDVTGEIDQSEDRMDRNRKRIDELSLLIREAERKIALQMRRCQLQEQQFAVSDSRLKQNRSLQATLAGQVSDLESRLKSCTREGCETITGRLEDLRYRLRDQREREDFLASDQEAKQGAMLECESVRKPVIDSIRPGLDSDREESNRLLAENRTLFASIKSQYQALKSFPGAIMSLSFAMGQDRIVRAYQEANRSLSGRLGFVAMPISGAVIDFDRIEDGGARNFPLVQSFEIAGLPIRSLSKLEGSPFPIGQDDENGKVFGASVGARAVFNFYGACRMDSSDSVHAPGRLASVLQATATYRYPLVVSRHVRIRYNEKQLYCMIKKHTVKNGIFKSSSSVELTENSNASQWLEIESGSEDPNYDYGGKDLLLFDLRKEILDRALSRVAMSYLSRDAGALIPPGSVLAQDASQRLRKCTNLFCQFAGVAVDLGNALFGGTEGTSGGCSDVGVSEVQEIRESRALAQYQTQSFAIEGRDAP